MKAYVTGATGCLGRNLVNVLLKDKWEIIVLHRKTSDLSRLTGCNVTCKEVDLYDIESVRQNVSRADALFHVAANTSYWRKEQEVQWKDNVLATHILAQVALEKGVGRFVLTSTGATLPFHHCDESAASRISSQYVRTKRLSELKVFDQVERGLDAVILQPIIVVGPYDYNSYAQCFPLIKQGKMAFALPGRLAFCHAEDVATAHVQAFYHGRCCENYVLGGEYASWLTFCQKIAGTMGVPGPKRIAPLWLLRPVSYGMLAASYVTNRRPLLTPELVNLLKDENDVTYQHKRQAKEELGYESRPLDVMVRDCFEWLVRENRI